METRPDALGRAAELFEQVLARDPLDRAPFIRQACCDDAPLCDLLSDMLRAHQRQGDFLAQPTGVGEIDGSSAELPSGVRAPASERPGTRIGLYTLLERIGEGGFGEVWRAEQREPMQRQVALKIIKLGMDTRQVIARFEAERQALALMDHPHIARVLDAGATESGRPYFVMELVKGVPITRFCDEHNLAIRDRLALFSDVCHAVQHAHQKGIIHRDLKPSNILVAGDEEGTKGHRDEGTAAGAVRSPVSLGPFFPSSRFAHVKIIDFGIAKAVAGAGPLTDKTLITEARQLIGTPAYMSPEQAGLSNHDIDTRSDVYSLGVLLYELLTGVTPFDRETLRRSSFDELRRIIREVDPPRPSARLSSLITAKGSAGVPPADDSSSRSLNPSIPKSLLRSLRGDLDWIAMKCLEKDRSRRYETANGLAADVQRFLNGEPVVAAPPGAGYRVRKFVQRHRGAVLTTTLVGAAMVAGMIGTLWQAARATGERNRAIAAHQKALKVKSLLERILTASSPMHTALRSGPAQTPLKPDVTLIEVLDGIAPTLEGEFGNEREVEADVRFALGKSYFGLSRFAESRRHLERALKLYRDLFGPDDPRALECVNILGFNYWWINDLDRAEVAFREAVAGAQRRGDPLAPRLGDAKLGLGLFLYNCTDKSPEAIRLAREVLALRRQILPEDSREVFMAKTTLAHVLRADEGARGEAERLATEALEQCLRAPLSRSTVDEWFCRIQAFDYSGERVDEAEEHGRNLVRIGDQISGPVSLMGTLGRTRLAHCLRGQRRWAEALHVYRESLASQRLIFHANDGHTMDTLDGIATACFEQWLLAPDKTELRDEAEKLAQEVAESWVITRSRLRGTPDAALLIRIYEARHVTEPDAGYDRKAAEWRAKLSASDAAVNLSPPERDAPERGPPVPSP